MDNIIYELQINHEMKHALSSSILNKSRQHRGDIVLLTEGQGF